MKNFKKITLGVLGALLIALGLYSCSNDETIQAESNSLKAREYKIPEIEDEIDQLFYEYVTSDSYIEVKNLTYQFLDKLNDDSYVFDVHSEKNVLDWISNNLSKTKFTSFQQAELEYKNVVNKTSLNLMKYSKIYKFLEIEDIQLVKVKVEKWFGDNVRLTLNTNCETKFSGCTSAAASQYAETYRLAQSVISDEGQLGSTAFDLKLLFERHMTACRENYDNCKNN